MQQTALRLDAALREAPDNPIGRFATGRTLLLLLACALAAVPTAVPAQIRIGVAGPITGANAVFGEQMRVGVEQAVADLNARGGVLGQRIELRIGDDACDPKQAVSVANLFSTDGVAAVVGHFCSASSIPARDVYAEHGIIQISPASAANRFTDEGSWNVFRTCGRDDQQGAFTGDGIAAEFRGRRIAILHDNSTYGKGVADSTKAAMNAAGVQEALYLAYTPGERDFTAIVSRLKATRIEVAYIGGYHTEIGLIARQAREQGLRLQFLGPSSLQTKELWQMGGEAIEGLRHAFYVDPRTVVSATDVVRALESRRIDPEGFVLYSYAAVQVWAQAAAAAGTTDARAVAARLRSGAVWPTVLGDMSFDSKGDPVSASYAWYVWSGGGYRPL